MREQKSEFIRALRDFADHGGNELWDPIYEPSMLRVKFTIDRAKHPNHCDVKITNLAAPRRYADLEELPV